MMQVSDVCLHPRTWARIFRGGVRTQQCNRPFLRPTPTCNEMKPEPHRQGSGPKRITCCSTVDGAFAWGRGKPPPA
jgi:hypothetical protein